jgi:hypothetical protein
MIGSGSILRVGSILMAALIGPGALAAARDHTPPRFAGLRMASTCIPGPVGGKETSSSYHLTWPPAKDNVTSSSRLRYDIYQATAPGGERFAVPTYTTRRGATAFSTSPLPSTKMYYFVVRARDAAGNRDRNRRERQGMNLCL